MVPLSYYSYFLCYLNFYLSCTFTACENNGEKQKCKMQTLEFENIESSLLHRSSRNYLGNKYVGVLFNGKQVPLENTIPSSL